MTTARLPMPFAENGLKTPIDLTNVDGSVSYDEGYSDDYSRELGVDALAKPVERDKMNYILNLITTNTLDWQNSAFPQWDSQTAYSQHAFVRWSGAAGQPEKVYRALQATTAGLMPNNPAYWEEQQPQAVLKALIPMQDMKLVTVAQDFNNFATGFYSFNDLAVLAACANNPDAGAPGILECYRYGTPTSAMQRFTNAMGTVYVRGLINGTWSAWAKLNPTQTAAAMLAFGSLNDTTSLDNLWSRGPGTWGRLAIPPANMGYPDALPGTLSQDGFYLDAAANSRMTQTYVCASGTWIRRRGGTEITAWERQVTPADLTAYVPINGDTIINGTKTFTQTVFMQNALAVRSTVVGDELGQFVNAAFRIGPNYQVFGDSGNSGWNFSYRTNVAHGFVTMGSRKDVGIGTYGGNNAFAHILAGDGLIHQPNTNNGNYCMTYAPSNFTRYIRRYANGGYWQWMRSNTGLPLSAGEFSCMTLDDNGNLNISAGMSASTYNSFSSKHLKVDHGPIKNALEIVMRLNPRMASLEKWYQPEDRRVRYTLFAEDTLAAGAEGMYIPKVGTIPADRDPSGEDTDYCGLDYDNGVPLLVAAIQEQQQTIKELTEIVINQEARLRKLEGR